MGIDHISDCTRISGEIVDLPEVLEVEKELQREDNLGEMCPFASQRRT